MVAEIQFFRSNKVTWVGTKTGASTMPCSSFINGFYTLGNRYKH